LKKVAAPTTVPAKGAKTRSPKAGAASKRASAPAALSISETDELFNRVVSILEAARGRIARAVNTETVTAYWLIGREIVDALQGGDPRAPYGARVIEDLSRRLTERYGKGFSSTNLWYFRQFFLAYASRRPVGEIPHPTGGESTRRRIPHLSGGEFVGRKKSHARGSRLVASTGGFDPALSWSHYRALMRVEKPEARNFYEQEAVACRWTKAQLERQIETLHYQRLLMSRDKKRMLEEARKADAPLRPVDALKDPYVLEFLDLPDVPALHESKLEEAIIANLQSFLLELGKGFSFVTRQKRMRLEDEDFYVDLVFYNYLLKCFVLIDLKVGKLTHQDIGQMDTYVRMFEAHEKLPGDNPTIGLILCSTKNEAVAKYSVLQESRQLFAARYLTYLPTEEELQRELERERRLIDARDTREGER
jgi:predicted nuclease of restriction endonuclease-like (RecB) superfamily